MVDPNVYSLVLDRALRWAEARYPLASRYRQAAFANAVAYLCTGVSGGYGGPSVREHCVSWLAGGRHDWSFEAACQFAEPVCFGPLPAIARQVWQVESCFDDDPEDLALLRADSV